MSGPRCILISRTDSIGDVMLTLPLTGMLKARWPKVRIVFLGRDYTVPVLRCCVHVDEVVSLDHLERLGPAAAVDQLRSMNVDTAIHVFPHRPVARWCKAAHIPQRIGTSHRWWHWYTCNERVAFSRRKSDLHEAQLNVKLLAPLGFNKIPELDVLANASGFVPPVMDTPVVDTPQDQRRVVIMHPLSKGSAVEWGLDHFTHLIHALDPARYRVVVTGTAAEAQRYARDLPLHLPHVVDLGGRSSLDELIAVIGKSFALIAASTGPLHIAAACGIRAIGLYAPIRPIHPGRWAPIGKDVHALVAKPVISSTDPVAHIRAITVEQVLHALEQQA